LKGKYRELMRKEFDKKTYWTQNREMMLKVLTHNIGIILLVKKLFYRAGPVHFLGPAANNDYMRMAARILSPAEPTLEMRRGEITIHAIF